MRSSGSAFALAALVGCSAPGDGAHADVTIQMPEVGAPASADLNGDGAPDLIAGAYNAIFVVANTAAGSGNTATFGDPMNITPAESPTSGFLTPQIVIADFNGDGRPDLAATNAGSTTGAGTIRIFTNTTSAATASSTFGAPVELPTQYRANTPIAIGDFNQDGKPDIAAWDGPNADRSVYSIAVFLNTTSAGATAPTFGAPVDVPAGLTYVGSQICVADVNRDAIPDLIAVLHDAANSRNLIGIMLGTTPSGSDTATFAPVMIMDVGPADSTSAGALAIADLDGDGAVDLIANHTDSPTVSILHNTSSPGGPASFADQPLDIGNTALDGLTAQDIDGDGAPDLVATTYDRVSSDPLQDIGTIDVLRNSTTAGAAPSFARDERRDVTPNGYPGGIAVADFNGDGHADVAVSLAGIAIDLGPW